MPRLAPIQALHRAALDADPFTHAAVRVEADVEQAAAADLAKVAGLGVARVGRCVRVLGHLGLQLWRHWEEVGRRPKDAGAEGRRRLLLAPCAVAVGHSPRFRRWCTELHGAAFAADAETFGRLVVCCLSHRARLALFCCLDGWNVSQTLRDGGGLETT